MYKFVETLVQDYSFDYAMAHAIYKVVASRWSQINDRTQIRPILHFPVLFAMTNNYTFIPKKRLVPRRGFRARWWRSMGELFNKRTWYQKGQVEQDDPTISPCYQYEIEGHFLAIKSQLGDVVRITVGYNPIADILYIMK